MDKQLDVDTEWEMEQGTFRGRLQALSVAMQLFIEQADEIGFENPQLFGEGDIE